MLITVDRVKDKEIEEKIIFLVNEEDDFGEAPRQKCSVPLVPDSFENE